ncbi:hypothetical protein DFH27DRAFT_49022 [Peziza echinospora]|nr:hypothetical protein DFH27DRAFT_49022 [Peziza echinospora]
MLHRTGSAAVLLRAAARQQLPAVRNSQRGVTTTTSPSSSIIRTSLPRPSTTSQRIPSLHSSLRNPSAQQQRRTLFENYKRRIEHERETGNLNKLRLPIFAAIFTIAAGLTLAFYGLTTYQAWSEKTLHNFPPSVAKELRRALYYATDPSTYRESLRHYISALEKAREEGLNPLSREVTGIKIEIARICELAGRTDKAVEVLRDVWTSLAQGVAKWDEEKRGDGRERTGLVKRAVETAVRLGGLLIEMEGRGKEGENVLEKAVEMVLSEERRREARFAAKGKTAPAASTAVAVPSETVLPSQDVMATDSSTGVDPDDVENDGWLSPLELASTFEILATYYLTTNRAYLSTPLLLHALTYLPAKSCHAATLMATISTSLASTHPASAQAWAEKAIDMATVGTPASERTDDCDEACVVAMCNLAELRWRDGDLEAAGRWFRDAGVAARKMQWDEGMKKVAEGLEMLEKEKVGK